MTIIGSVDSLMRLKGMDSRFRKRNCFTTYVVVGIGLLFGSNHYVFAEEFEQARVTQVINDVKLLPNQAAPRPAAVNDEVKQGTAVRTGADSRTELTFANLTITRLGANTVFTFK